jgi:multiple sugar transport system permease protein
MARLPDHLAMATDQLRALASRRRGGSSVPGAGRGGWRHLPALLIATVFLLPLVFMVSGSLRQAGLPPPRSLELVPDPVALGNYPRAFALVDIPHYIRNSLLVSASVVPLSVLVASLAGFAMTRLSRRMAAALVALSLAALMIPLTGLLVSRFAIFRLLRLTDTYWALVMPSLIGITPFYILLFYWSFRRVPAELYEACRLEGLSPLATWRRVAMPLVRPVTVAVAVLAFVDTWSNFLDPLIYLSDERKFTVPLGLRSLTTLDRSNYPLFLAGAVTATAPVIVAILSVQRFFLRGPSSPDTGEQHADGP